MDSATRERLGLGPIDQVAYVVSDLEASLPRYTGIFGPFEVADAPLRECRFRGRTVDCHFRLAVNRTGPVEVELVQPVGGESPQAEHLRAHGEGLHHVRFRVDDLDARIAALEAEGFAAVFHKRLGPRVAFAYLETPPDLGGSLIELLELP